MNKINKSRVISLIPAIWASLLDISITILGQPAEYWNGNLNIAKESNPIGAFFMKNHVSGLFIISGLWISIIILLGYKLPKRISRIFLLFILIVHSWGVSTWIPSKYFMLLSILLFIFNSILYIMMDELSTHSSAMVVTGTAKSEISNQAPA